MSLTLNSGNTYRELYESTFVLEAPPTMPEWHMSLAMLLDRRIRYV